MTTEHKPGELLNQILNDIKSQPLPSKNISPSPSFKKGERAMLTSLKNLFEDTNPLTIPIPENESVRNPFPLPNVEWIKSISQLKKVIPLFEKPAIGLAIFCEGELDPFSSPLLSVQITTNESQTYIIERFENDHLKVLEPILLSSKICKVMYNAKPILRYFFAKGLSFHIKNLMDLMLVDQIYHAGEMDISYTLEDLVLRELNMQLPPASMQSAYLASVSAVLHLLASKMWPRVKAEHLDQIAKLEHEVVKTIALMENNGVFFNPVSLAKVHHDQTQRLEELVRELTPLLSDHRESILGIIPRKINLDSRVQVKKALAKQGIVVTNTDEATLAPYAKQYPFVAKLIEYNKHKYAVSSFSGSILKHIHPVTGRVHSHFGQIETTTGRINSYEPSLQNIKRGEHRSYLQAAPGHLLVIADYKQIDIVVAAVMASEEKMLKVIREGGDIHLQTAMMISGKTKPEEISVEERRKAKAVNFGLLYKMTAYGLVQYAKVMFEVNMTIREAQGIIDLYHGEYKNLTSWQDKLIIETNQSFETRTLWNRRRLFKMNDFTVNDLSDNLQKTLSGLGLNPERVEGKLQFAVSHQRTPEIGGILESLNVKYCLSPQLPKPSEIVNSPVQGTAANIIKLAQVYVTQTLLKLRTGKLILNVHDELLVESPEDKIKDISQAVTRCMEDAGEEILKNIRPRVSVSIGPSWNCK